MKFNLGKLSEIKTSRFDLHAGSDVDISGISIDTRTLKGGELYVALRGENHDGHAFVHTAYEQGAAAALVERSWFDTQTNELQDKVIVTTQDTILGLQSIANWQRKAWTCPVLAITGTNGKTTTKEILGALLQSRFNTAMTKGNFNNHIGVPLTLTSVDSNPDIAIIEMGMNHSGEIKRLCEIADPTAGLITNVGTGHIGFFKDVTAVAHAKMELFDYLYPDGLAFINIDDARVADMAPDFKKTVKYGFTDEADISAKITDIDRDGCTQIEVEQTTLRINLPGRHNAQNALAAIAVAREFGLQITEIKNGFEKLVPTPKRMEIRRIDGITVIDDTYNANPESTLAALETLQRLKQSGRAIFVFGDMLELGEATEKEHKKISSVLTEYQVDFAFTHGPASRIIGTDEKTIRSEVQVQHFEDKSELFEVLLEILKPGDTLLVKGSRGMKMEDVIYKLLDAKQS